MKFIVKTSFGLEQILLNQLENLGGKSCIALNRAVECEGDMDFLFKAALDAPAALRILQPFRETMIHTEKDLYRKISDIQWDEYFGVNQTFAIDSFVNSTAFNHSQFVTHRVKDAIVDQFREKYQIRPNVDPEMPDFRLNVHISEKKMTLSIDCIGFSLHKRGYRVFGHPSPMNEVLAGGMIALSEWDGSSDLMDPMCGSGTILIEAAMKAANIPCNWNVKHFCFMNWKEFDIQKWRSLRKKYQDNFIKPQNKFIGNDIDVKAIENAKECAMNAGVSDFIEFHNTSFEKLDIPFSDGVIICNPPYGERLELDDAIEFYKTIGDILKTNYSDNNIAFFISSNIPAMKHLGLRPSRKIQLFNGKLECRLMKYELYKGSKKASK